MANAEPVGVSRGCPGGGGSDGGHTAQYRWGHGQSSPSPFSPDPRHPGAELSGVTGITAGQAPGLGGWAVTGVGQGHLRTPAEPACSPLSAPVLQSRGSDPAGYRRMWKPPWTGLSGSLSPGAQHRLEPSVDWRGRGRRALTGTEDGRQSLARKDSWHLSSCFRGTA